MRTVQGQVEDGAKWNFTLDWCAVAIAQDKIRKNALFILIYVFNA